MNFVIKSFAGETDKFISVTPELIANQRVGSRLEFKMKCDVMVEFADGMVMIDDIDLIIYIIPNEYFCYRNDQFVLKFVLGSRKVQLDHRPIAGGTNARVIISSC